MMQNKLLEFLIENSRPEEYYAHYYQIEPSIKRPDKDEAIFHINGITSKMRYDAHSESFGFKEYGELFKDAYIKHLELEKLQRGKKTGPDRLQSGNWAYTQKMSTQNGFPVFLAFDLDTEKDYIQITIQTRTDDTIREKLVTETNRFMQQAGIPQEKEPKR
jgi:hypothetical protein